MDNQSTPRYCRGCQPHGPQDPKDLNFSWYVCISCAADLQAPALGDMTAGDADERAARFKGLKSFGSVLEQTYAFANGTICTSDPREMKVEAPAARIGSVLIHDSPSHASFHPLEMLDIPNVNELRQQLVDASNERDALRARKAGPFDEQIERARFLKWYSENFCNGASSDEIADPEDVAATLESELDAFARTGKYDFYTEWRWQAWKERARLHLPAAGISRLRQFETALSEWADKTEWLRKSIEPKELGMHLADVMKGRIDKLTAANKHFRHAQEDSIAMVVREREQLLSAMKVFREAFVVAVGDKSTFAKIALGKVDAVFSKPALSEREAYSPVEPPEATGDCHDDDLGEGETERASEGR